MGGAAKGAAGGKRGTKAGKAQAGKSRRNITMAFARRYTVGARGGLVKVRRQR